MEEGVKLADFRIEELLKCSVFFLSFHLNFLWICQTTAKISANTNRQLGQVLVLVFRVPW